MTGDQLQPAIQRVRLDRLRIFEITEAELDSLERGSPESIFLNLGIASFSTALTLLVALFTATVSDLRVFCVFVIVCTVSFVAGATF